MRAFKSIAIPLILAFGVSLSGGAAPDLKGLWRATFASPGGELPFGLVFEAAPGGLAASVVNGPEKVPFTSVSVRDRSISLRFDHYDSEIVAEIDPAGDTMRGTWTRQANKTRASMPFTAARVKGSSPASSGGDGDLPARFGPRPSPPGSDSVRDVSGAWDVVFKDEDGTEPARGEFRQTGSRLLGTFLTPTGDYRYLAGDWGDGILRLSCFDGSHAFLFIARAAPDGTLTGDFWSRSSYHATWTAKRSGDVESAATARGTGVTAISAMPDPFAMTALRSPSGKLRFTFPDLDGKPVSLSDPKFKGKAVLVDIFGSWCPNCNDQAPVLEELYLKYHDRGLEIIGLAYEMTGDAARDTTFVRKYAERHHVAYPLLLAGTSDKAEASTTLPDLTGVLAFPTLIFIDRGGAVRAIHTGFAGPGTGSHFTDLKERYVSLIEGMLQEPVPAAASR